MGKLKHNGVVFVALMVAFALGQRPRRPSVIKDCFMRTHGPTNVHWHVMWACGYLWAHRSAKRRGDVIEFQGLIEATSFFFRAVLGRCGVRSSLFSGRIW